MDLSQRSELGFRVEARPMGYVVRYDYYRYTEQDYPAGLKEQTDYGMAWDWDRIMLWCLADAHRRARKHNGVAYWGTALWDGNVTVRRVRLVRSERGN